MEDKVKEVIRGLEAELPQRASFRIIDVLSGISLDHYKIFTPGCRIWPKFAPVSVSGLISPQDLRTLSTEKYAIEELSLHFFRVTRSRESFGITQIIWKAPVFAVFCTTIVTSLKSM